MDNRLIGVFDSGVGGLTVDYEIFKQLNGESFLYFGDTARNPYGTRSMSEVAEFSQQIASFLQHNGAKVIVIACNTATIASLDLLSSTCDVPVIGVVDSSVSYTSEVTTNGVIGVMATEGSVKSRVFEKKLLKVNPDYRVISTACQDLVRLAEAGIFEGEEVKKAIAYYLEDMKECGVDTVILGCTHFPLFEKAIAEELGSGVTIINPAEKVTQGLAQLLQQNDALADGKNPKRLFCTNSKDNTNFIKLCRKVFAEPCHVEYIATEDMINGKVVFEH